MRKKIVMFFLTLILSTKIHAQEDCLKSPLTENTGNIQKLSATVAIIAEKSSDENVVKLEAATTYLMSISEVTNFNESEASHFVSILTPLCESSDLKPGFRSDVCLRLSGLQGKLGQKLGMSGLSYVANSFKYLKMALSLNPDNSDAAIAHASAIAGIYDLGFVVRKMAESKLDVNANSEAKKAKANLERLKLTSQPVYSKILDIL